MYAYRTSPQPEPALRDNFPHRRQHNAAIPPTRTTGVGIRGLLSPKAPKRLPSSMRDPSTRKLRDFDAIAVNTNHWRRHCQRRCPFFPAGDVRLDATFGIGSNAETTPRENNQILVDEGPRNDSRTSEPSENKQITKKRTFNRMTISQCAPPSDSRFIWNHGRFFESAETTPLAARGSSAETSG